MISKECAQAIALIRKWRAEIDASGEELNVINARADFKLYSRPPAVVAARSFRANGVLSEWVCAPNADPDNRLLYLHGGGFICGDLDTTVPFAELISEVSGCSVLAIEYGLAPEHPFPHALNEALNAFRWLRYHSPQGPATAKKLFIAGDSAGAGLALSTLLKLRDDGEQLPRGAVALSAYTDLSLSHDFWQPPEIDDPVLDINFLRFCSDAYASGQDKRNPYISPIFGDCSGLPPLFMQVGTSEILLGQTERFAEKARKAGVLVTLEVWPHMFHGWQLFGFQVPESREALAAVGNFIRSC